MQLRNDRALAKLVDIRPTRLSKIRNRKLPVGESFLLRSHEATDIPVKALRVLMGDRRKQLVIGMLELGGLLARRGKNAQGDK